MATSKWQEFKQRHLGGTTPRSSFSPSSQQLYNSYAREEESEWEKFKRKHNVGAQMPQGIVEHQKAQEQSYKMQAEQEKAHREARAQMLPELENKIGSGMTLTPTEELQYAKASIEALSDGERDVMAQIKKGQDQNFSDHAKYDMNGSLGFGQQLMNKYVLKTDTASGTGNATIKEAQDILRNEYGWDDNKIKNYTLMSERLSNAQGTEEFNKAFAISQDDSNKIGKAAANTAWNLFNAPIEGVSGVMSNLKARPEGFGRDTNTWMNLRQNSADAATEQVTQNAITDAKPVGQFLYQAGLSTAESAARAMVGSSFGDGKLRSAITSGMSAAGVYNSSYQNARERGATDTQAQLFGIGAGMAEAAGNYFPLEHFWNMTKGTKVGKNLAAEWLAQAGMEAGEEAITDLVTRIADYMVLGKDGKSEMDIARSNYMEQGMSEEEANKAAEADFWKQVGLDALGGAISGGIFGAGGFVAGNMNAAQNKQNAEAIQGYFKDAEIDASTEYGAALKQDADKYASNPTQYMADMIDDSTAEGKKRKAEVQKLAQKEAQGQRLTASDRNYIEESLYVADLAVKQSEEAMSARERYEKYSNEMSAVPSEYRTARTSITEDEARADLGKAAANKDIELLGETYSKMKNAKSAELRNKADEIYAEYYGMAESKGIAREQLEAFKISPQEAYSAGLKGEGRGNVGALSMKAAEAYRAGQKAYIENRNATVVESKSNLQKANALTKDGKNLVLTGTFTSDGNMLTQDGEHIALSDVSMEDNAVQKVYRFADTLPSVAAKNAYMGNMKDGTTVATYNEAWSGMFRAGRTGRSFESVMDSGRYVAHANTLGEDTLRAMYEAGVAQTKHENAVEATNGLNKAFNIKKGSGVFEDARADKSDNINTEVLRVMANITGMNIRLVDDKTALIKEGANAYIDQKNDTVVVGSHATAQVFHEVLGEFTKMYASKEYADFKKVAMETSAEILGEDTHNAIMDSYARAYGSAGESNTDAEMSDEMANDFIVAVLSTEKGRQMLAKKMVEKYTPQEANTIKDKIVNLYKSIIRSIKNIINRTNLMGYQKALLEKNCNDLEKTIDHIMNAIDSAIENHAKIEDGATITGETAFSINVDSEGNKLSEQQQEFFADSKIRDNDGKLKVMHHGSIAYGFSVFDIKKAKHAGLYGRGFYFSDSDSHAGQYGKTYNVYLNIVNPVTANTNNITKEQLRAFVEEIANDEDYGIENYGYGATPESVTNDVWGKDDFSMLQDINATCVGDFASAVKLFNRVNGTTYDGIVVPTETVAFYSNQIKEVTNEKPTSVPDIRFSMKVDPEDYKSMSKDIPSKNTLEGTAPVEQTENLIAVHNMTTEQLAADIELGGLPSPSIAIIKAGMEHSKYGNVSLLFRKATINPATNKQNKVYGGDAWTPTFPSVDVKISEKVRKSIENKIEKLVPDNVSSALGGIRLDNDNMTDKVNRRNGDFADAYMDEDVMKYAFLSDKGIKVEEGKREKRIAYGNFKNAQIVAVANVIDADEVEAYIEEGYSYFEKHPEVVEKVRVALNEQFRSANGNAKFASIREQLKRDLYEELYFNQFDTIMRGVYNYKTDGMQYEADPTTLRENINAALNETEYKEWFEKLFEGIVEKRGLRNNKDTFTYSGNRRSWEALHDDVTLENIVKIMNSQDAKGADSFFAQSAIQAYATKDFKSIDEIHAAEGQLRMISEEEHSQIKEEHANRFNEICSDIMDKSERNSFTAFDRAADAIADALKSRKTVKGIDSVLREYRNLDIKSDTAKKIFELVKDISNMPTGYFEAKPRRAVWLNEIALAVVPNTTPAKTLQELEKNGIPYEVYEEGKEEERTRILANAEGVKFSIKVTTEGYKYVNIDVDQKRFKNMSKIEKVREARKVINEKFRNKRIGYVDGTQVFGNKRTLDHYAGAARRQYSDETTEAKMRASTELDNLLKISAVVEHSDYEDVKANHPEAVQGITRYKTIFKVGDGYYEGVINVINEKDFRLFYDITKIRSVPRVDDIANNGKLEREASYKKMLAYYKNLDNRENGSGKKNFSLEVDDFFDIFNGEDTDFANGASILEEGMEALKHQKVDSTKIRSVAHKIRKEFGSTYNFNTLVDNLEKVFAHMQTSDHVNYNDMMRVLQEVATPVIDAATTLEGKEQYDAFVKALKGYSIRLTDVQKREVISDFGTYGQFRRMMMPLNISDNGSTDLESVWSEIADASGGVLDADTVEGDMPTALYDALAALRPSPVNSYGGNKDDVAKDAAMRIVEEYLGTHGSVAKDAAKKMKEQRAEYENKLKETRTKNRQAAKNARRKRLADHEKKMIGKRASELMKWVSNPTEKKHVPRDMVEPVVEFLYALDFVEPEVKQNKNGKWYVRVFNHSVIGADGKRSMVFDTLEANTRDEALKMFYDAIGSGEGSKAQRTWTDRMRLIENIFNQVASGKPFDNREMDDFMETIDPALADEFTDMLKRNGGTAHINQLEYEDLHLINKALRGITHAINQGNKAFTNNATIEEMARSTIELAEGKKVSDKELEVGKSIKKLLNLDMLTPQTYFHIQGKGGDMIYDSLRKGFNTEIMDVKKSQEFMKKLLKDVKDLKKWTGEEAEVFEIPTSAGTIRLTTAQIMSLHMTSKRKQAMEHMAGGFRPDDIKSKYARLFAKTTKQKDFHLTEADIKNITDKLTDKQKEVATRMQKFLAKDCAEWGNEASMKMYGYEKFVEENYFPIKTVSHTNRKKNENIATETLNGIERSGFTKQIKEGARNPILIRDIFDVFTEHVEGMAAYHGKAAAIKDANRWFNYRIINEDDGWQNWKTTQEAIETNSGVGGVNYYTKLMSDINGQTRSQYIGFTEKLMSNYKAASVGFNLRVVMQQPTSYLRAMNVINPKYLISVNPKKMIGAGARVKENSPIAWWKAQGHRENAVSKSMRSTIIGDQTLAEKVKDFSMAAAGKADDITWGILYEAVVKEQRDVTKGMGLTEEQFRQRVNDRFDEVVDKTQVVDSTLHRSQFMRSKDKLNVLQTAFMSEPTKTYNMMYESMRDGKKAATRAFATYLITAAATSAAASVADMIRYTEDGEEPDEVWWENFTKTYMENIMPWNLIPTIKDIAPYIVSFVTGERTYTSSNRMDIDAVYNMAKAFKEILKAASGESDKNFYGVAYSTAQAFSQLTGIPASNIVREVVAIHNFFLPDIKKTKTTNPYNLIYDEIKKKNGDVEGKVKYVMDNNGNIKNIESGITSRYKSDYYDAYQKNPEEAQKIADEAKVGLVAIGMTDEEADATIEGWQTKNKTYAEIDKAIESGEGIVEEIELLMEEKKEDDIVEHIYNEYSSTIEYNRKNNIQSDVEDNVNIALESINKKYSYDERKNFYKEKADKKAADEAFKEKRTTNNQKIFNSIDTGANLKEAQKSVQELLKSGVDAKTIKSDITKQYKEKLVSDYKAGKNIHKERERIIAMKVYIDEVSGFTGAKDYRKHEEKEIADWFKD